MEEWKIYRLGDVCLTNQNQYSPRENWHTIEYLDTGSITRNAIESTQTITAAEELPSRARRKVQDLDIVYSTVRPNQCHYGLLRNPAHNLLVSTGFVVFTVNQSIANPYYVFYYLTQDSITTALQAIAEQSVSAYPSLKPADIEDIKIELPPLEVQNRIADILSSIDNKIELNTRINHNLEEQAQALYKSWFVDFEPFKDGKFVESELGMIPEGWRVGNLGELLDIRYGKDHKNLSDGPYPVYGSGGFMRKVERPLFEGESVLIPRKGSLNNVMYVNEAFWSVDTMFYSVEKMPNVAKYCYQILSQKDLASMNSGSAVPSMSTDILNTIQVIIPDKKVLEYYNIILSRVFSSCASIRNESFCLVDIRNSILPKLMNGEILC